jgi:hypothetical protein
MKLLPAVAILTALGPPDWLPPSPEVMFTQVDQNGNELSDNYPATCGMDACRAALPVHFRSGQCLVSGWVRLPEPTGVPSAVILSAGLCTSPKPMSVETRILGGFKLDAHGAASATVEIGSDPGPVRDLVRRAEDIAYVRVDVIASTHAH